MALQYPVTLVVAVEQPEGRRGKSRPLKNPPLNRTAKETRAGSVNISSTGKKRLERHSSCLRPELRVLMPPLYRYLVPVAVGGLGLRTGSARGIDVTSDPAPSRKLRHKGPESRDEISTWNSHYRIDCPLSYHP